MKKIKKMTNILVLLFIFMLISASGARANYSESNSNDSDVNSITVSGSGNKISWSVDGYSSQGFKVVWSKNANPTYPLRSRDKYNYYSNSDQRSDELTAFDGSGTYYVRACEYLGGKCGKYSNQITLTLGDSSDDDSNICCKSFGYGSEMKIVNETYSWKTKSECSIADGLVGGGKEIVDNSYCEQKEGVNSITLTAEGDSLKWDVAGYSSQGFKVVWSKNANPTYPTRTQDRYTYHSNSDTRSSEVSAFDGSGNYYVRVCEYLGGSCGVYSNQIQVELQAEEKELVICTMDYSPVCGKNGKTYSNMCAAEADNAEYAYEGECKKDSDIIEIEEKANYLYEEKLDEILKELDELRDLVKEQQAQIKYLTDLKDEVNELSSKIESMINNFITYGVDENTEKLGAGERAAVMYSFKNAYGKLPESEDEITDAIKIANGRWPSEKSETAENKARENFQYIYKREANMDNLNDNAAITIMAYGLRQKAQNRNLESEKKGIAIFKSIYGHTPSNTEEWNILQAITYSGASR